VHSRPPNPCPSGTHRDAPDWLTASYRPRALPKRGNGPSGRVPGLCVFKNTNGFRTQERERALWSGEASSQVLSLCSAEPIRRERGPCGCPAPSAAQANCRPYPPIDCPPPASTHSG
jgi:hypothetical protein